MVFIHQTDIDEGSCLCQTWAETEEIVQAVPCSENM